jgi:hypothetical protein
MKNQARWINRPAGSNWGDFGADDEIGRVNLITQEKVMQGTAEIKVGKRFCLSLPLDYPGGNVLHPRRFPPVLRPTLRAGKPYFNFPIDNVIKDATDVVCDDLALLHLQYSTHWDGLAHIGYRFDADGDGLPESVYYNGYRAGVDVIGPDSVDDAGSAGISEMRSTSKATALGIENMAEQGIQGRAVMIDLMHHLGPQRRVVGYDDVMEVLKKDNIRVERGDMVCFHTGFADLIFQMGGNPDIDVLNGAGAELNGRDQRLLEWITESQLAVIIADNFGVEVHPALPAAGCCASFPLHEHCLFKLGVHLGELWHLTPLARWLRENGRHHFFLTAPPLRLPGAVGSPLTPVATV